MDCVEKFVSRPAASRREEYLRVYGAACSYNSSGGEVSDVLLSEDLGRLEHINRPCNFDTLLVSMRVALGQLGPNSIQKNLCVHSHVY